MLLQLSGLVDHARTSRDQKTVNAVVYEQRIQIMNAALRKKWIGIGELRYIPRCVAGHPLEDFKFSIIVSVNALKWLLVSRKMAPGAILVELSEMHFNGEG